MGEEGLGLGRLGEVAAVWVLGVVEAELAQLVEGDRRGLAEVEDGVVGRCGDRADRVDPRELVVGEADPLGAEDEGDGALDHAQLAGELSRRRERVADVSGPRLVRDRGEPDRRVGLDERVEADLGRAREDVLAGAAGEAVGLAVGVEGGRIDQEELLEAEVLHRSGDRADVPGRLGPDDGHRRLHVG